METISQLLNNSQHVLLASHVNPDGDAIGSLMALGLALESQGKRITLLNESPIPAVYQFLPGTERICNRIDGDPRFDTVVILDCGDLVRVGSQHARLLEYPVAINIDHHVTNTGFGTHQLIDPEACATAEIVYRLMARMGIDLSSDMATAIYTAIFTDTGSFRFSNTNEAAFGICKEMISHGVDPYKVAQHVYGTYSLGRIKLLNLALDSIELAAGGKLSIMTVSKDMLEETRTQPEDADGLIHYAKRIEDVRMAALIQEQSNGSDPAASGHRYHVSLRSDGSIDVAAIASAFGGGGHTSAAGFNMDASLEDIKRRIIELAEST